jgi:hypothetical protein
VDIRSVYHVACQSWSVEHGPVGGSIVVGNEFEDTGPMVTQDGSLVASLL